MGKRRDNDRERGGERGERKGARERRKEKRERARERDSQEGVNYRDSNCYRLLKVSIDLNSKAY